MCLFLAKKKEEKVKKEKEDFDINIALKTVSPFMMEGFKKFLLDKNVKSQKEFDELLGIYGGV